MANKYSKSNISVKTKEEKTAKQYQESKSRLNTTARIMAIIMIAAMVITFTLMTGLFAFD